MTDLDALLKKAREVVDAMTEEERRTMVKEQIRGAVRAEMSWPKAKYKWENGAKVYESYEDYCND